MTTLPLHERRFHLDGVPVDIEDFISVNSNDFEEAAILREDIMSLAVDYHMFFGGGAVPERDLFRWQ